MTLEDCERNVPKRVSKLENFLRKKLPLADLSRLRYYEVCVLESKGTLLVRYIILTEDSILMTENPPKSLFFITHISLIQDISLVADRESLVTGSQGNSPFVCRHIQILYKVEDDSDSSKKKKEKSSNLLLPPDEGRGSSASNSSCSSTEEISSTFSSVTEISLLSEMNRESRHKKSLPKIPSFLGQAYDPFSDVPSSSSSPTAIDSDFSSEDLTSLKRRTRTSKSQHNGISTTCEKDDCDAKSLESLSTSISIEHGDDIDVTSTNGNIVIRNTQHFELNQDDDKQRASSVLESKGSKEDLKERPQSIDISQLSTLRAKFIPNYFSKKIGKGLKPQQQPQSQRIEESLNDHDRSSGYSSNSQEYLNEPKFKIMELNFYLYQQPSAFLNELYLVWNRSALMYGAFDKKEQLFMISETEENEQVFSLRAAEKIMKSFSQEKVLMDPHYFSKFSKLLPILCRVEQGLVKYHHLRRLIWRNTSFIRNLVELVKHSVHPEEEDEEGLEVEESQHHFLERVNVFSILMDIFRLLYESCNTSFLVQSSDKNSPAHLSHAVITTNLLHVLFSYPIVSGKIPSRHKILRIIFDPQTFAKLHWMDSHESNAIKALYVAHNAFAALLYEILSLVYFSRRDSEKMTFMTLLRKYSLESYVRQSVTQIINLLWSSPTRQPLNTSQCALLYRHVYVLKALLDNIHTVKTFVRISFCEEFQYFVHRNCINTKISDRYPIKPKLVQIFDQLRLDIMERE